MPAPPVPADAPLIPGTFIYGGPVWHSFGHCIAEFVHRMWVTERPEWRDAPVAFIATEGRPVPGFLGEIMSLLGVRAWRVLEGPARIERLVVAEQGKMLHCPPAPAYVEFLRRRLSHLADEPPRFPRRLAVLRGHLGAGRGRCVGENWLLRQLVALGYAEFRPETLPIADQANAYVHAEKIIFSEGSAIHLFDILPPVRAEIAVLNRRPGSHLGQDSLQSKAARLHLYDGVRLLGDPRGGLTATLGLFDPRAVLDFLQKAGMIPAIAVPDLLEEAEELAEDIAGFVRARHPAAAVRRTHDEERLLAETITYLARQALRGPAHAAPTNVAAPAPRRRGPLP
ncbi:MAG: glycosyltransferase family 61 protein [Roseococcus sp.]|nr:glycosyltransferase family 61 protein [Roseococcus sp.]